MLGEDIRQDAERMEEPGRADDCYGILSPGRSMVAAHTDSAVLVHHVRITHNQTC